MTKKILFVTAGIAALIIIIFSIRSLIQTTQISEPENAIQNTNGVLHIVDLDDVLSGGPDRDAIPPINDPSFQNVQEAEGTVADTDSGVAIQIGSKNRFYPLHILAWHEVINDRMSDTSFVVTYSPLTASAAVFNSTVDGNTLVFGNTGKLWDSNSVLYDKSTESEWSQILGKAIIGPKSGTQLTQIPSVVQTYGSWKNQHPKGEVLTQPTDTNFDYSRDPNQSYYENDQLFFPALHKDTRLSAKTTVFGVQIGEREKAYPLKTLQQHNSLSDGMSGFLYTINYDTKSGAITITANAPDAPIKTMQTYWFAWVGAFPNTSLYN